MSTRAYAEEETKRNFYDVLEDVLSDFEYDLKQNAVKGVRAVAVRFIGVSENVPESFKSHLELVITERILKHSSSRVIQCIPCKSKKASLQGDSLVVSSTDSNPAELAKIAELNGIETYLDISFSYQQRGMILSLGISDPESGAVIWSKSYNSETSRAAAFRRGVDYDQIAKARTQENYEPIVQFRATIYYLFEPTTTGTSGALAGGVRVVERYKNRKNEVGFEANYIREATSIVDTSATTSLYSGFNVTMLFMHSWNLIGEIEQYNSIRGNIFAGVGGTYASGYLSGLVRAGFEWRLGKHFAVCLLAGYRPEASQFISGTLTGTVSGVEFGAGISGLF